MRQLLLFSLFGGCIFISPFWLEQCGDLVLHPNEECDDGNTNSSDGCNNECLLEIPTDCGDGTVNPTEICDDGNSVDGDGCDSNCTPTSCGNNIVTPPEACDDANTINNDGCNNDCTLPQCGNFLIDPNEACDDGNLTNGDGCNALCQIETCGDGVLASGERCFDAISIATQGNSSSLLVADLNNDSSDDIALCSATQIEIFIGGGDQVFFPSTSFETNQGSCTSIVAGNFGGTPPGIAVSFAGALSGSIEVITQTQGIPSRRTISMPNELPLDMKTTDLEGDGFSELLITIQNTNTLRILSQINSLQDIKQDINNIASPFSLALGNFDDDTLLDLVQTSSALSSANIFTQVNGGFSLSSALNLGQTDCLFAKSADLVGNNREDIVFSCRSSQQLLLHEQLSAGTFEEAVVIPVAIGTPTALDLADLDGDGDTDIIVSDQSTIGSVLLLFNNNGSFQETLRFSTGSAPSDIALGDFNFDNLPDIAIANAGSPAVTLLLSNP
jgi:cysteine-rich repeat protein